MPIVTAFIESSPSAYSTIATFNTTAQTIVILAPQHLVLELSTFPSWYCSGLHVDPMRSP